jgi:hypothetical protein
MPLTDAAARNAKPAAKTVRMFDRDGLYLEVSPGGGKWWRLKYRYAGKEKRVSLGVYPEVNLKKARARTIDARQSRTGGRRGEQLQSGYPRVDRPADEILGQGSRRTNTDPVRTRRISLDRRSPDCGFDGAGTADDGEAHRKARRAGDRPSRARQLRPGVPLRHRTSKFHQGPRSCVAHTGRMYGSNLSL